MGIKTENKVKNICRPITFYNNFVPPSNIKQTWEYEALGYYDGITVGEDLAKEGEFSFNQMWSVLAVQAKKLSGNFTSQTIHIYRTECGDEVITDEEFWNGRGETDEFPFLFIVMLRLKGRADCLPQFKADIEMKMKTEGGKIITYLSLDNNDLIVVLRSREYLEGTRVIDRFHQNVMSVGEKKIPVSEIYDSFSICGVNKKCLNSSKYQFYNGEERISRICLRVIEKEPGSVRLLERELKKVFGGQCVYNYPVLGCEDEVFLLEDIPSEKFWKQYQDEQGVLSSSNESTYKVSVIGITALVLQPRLKENQLEENAAKTEKHSSEEHTTDAEEQSSEGSKNNKSIWEAHRNKCIEYLQKEGVGQSHVEMYYKAILQIINSLQKYENIDYKDHIYVALYNPMKMLLELLDETPVDKKEEVMKEISTFFYAINLLTQNSVRLERQFIQSVELNARIYEAPVQLSTFYSAYFRRLRDVLNEGVKERHKYEFMICPGMAKYLNVKRLLPRASREKRLLLVEIPERQMYDIKNQMVIMAHEAAHFVGTDIRQREKRYDDMLRAIVKSVSIFLVLDEDMHQYCDEKSIEMFEAEYYEALKNEAEAYCDAIEQLSGNDRRREDRFHAEFMKEDLWRCAQSVLLGDQNLLDNIGINAFDRKTAAMKQKNMRIRRRVEETEDFFEDFGENRNRFLIKITIPSETMSDERCICNIIEHNIHIFKEAFADLLSILLLNLDIDAYLEVFLEGSSRMNGIRTVVSGVTWRTAIVVKAMLEGAFADKESWSKENLEKIAQSSENKQKRGLAKNILDVFKNHLSTKNNIFTLYEKEETIRISNRNMDRLYNPEVCDIFCGYLKSCGEKFCEKEKSDKDSKDRLDKLREIYRTLSRIDNIEEYILYIRKEIEGYEMGL